MSAERRRILTKRESDSTYQTGVITKEATQLTNELKGLTKEIEFLTPYLATLEAGDEKTKREKELRRASARRGELLSRQAAQGAVALLERQLEQTETTVRLEAVAAYETKVRQRKDELLAAQG
ncbi:hypothetical protein [Hymenobacter cellulosilyticus]|uniref:Uncharacterized protein n=1 Tax=Hymenobacter cellulosilyticus TaxID=2932248 RepID=A0A8T9Q7R9_9BACT|nr:hypothetical protein [Hymenobacter cellulosilyticus]UOQ73554.1 hypothetical protein MUN79_06385 [Hymenobacter cellulosilyticus]